MFGSICPCGVEGFAWLDKREIFVLSDSACIYEHAGHRLLNNIFVCDIKNICSVIAIIPRTLTLPSGIEGNFFDMVEKPGLDISDLGVLYSIYSQPEDDEDDQGSNDADVE